MAFSSRWKRYGCCPEDQDDYPSNPRNLAIFEVTGYNYRTIPQWFDSTGQKLIAVQFSVLYEKLYYRWTFYRPQGRICSTPYFLSTSDDIVPTINEATTGTPMKVERVARHNAYTTWKVYC
jgi:hypothetical protein